MLISNILNNTISVIIIKGTSLGIRIAVILISAKILPTEKFNEILILMSLSEIFRAVADFGIDTINTRSFSLYRSHLKTKNLIRKTFHIKIIFGLLASLTAMSLIILIKPEANINLIIAYILMVITPLLINIPINLKLSRRQGSQIILPVIISGVASLITFSIAVSIKSFQSVAFFAIPLFEFFIFTFLIYKIPIAHTALLKNKTALFYQKIDKDILLKATPIAIAIIISLLYSRSDVFFLDKFSTAANLATYGIAIRLIETFQFISSSISVNAYGHLSSLITEKSKFQRAYKTYYFLGLSYSSTIAIFITTLLYLNSQYNFFPYFTEDNKFIFITLSLALIVKSLNLVSTSALQALGYFRTITVLSASNLILAILFYSITSKNYGALGVSLSILTIESINLIAQSILLYQVRSKYFI